MPYISLADPAPGVHLGMWKIEEDEFFFQSRLNIYENEKKIINSISNQNKRLEWLSSRLCLKELLKIRHKVESLNETTGKPYLSDNSYNISYSHSMHYAGVIASACTEVSMDLEYLKKKRNPEVRFQFMHEKELAYFERSKHPMDYFFLVWSAKETLYKIFGKKGIIFKENFLILPSNGIDKPCGSVRGIIRHQEINQEYEIQYHFFESVLLTYAIGDSKLRGERSGAIAGRGFN